MMRSLHVSPRHIGITFVMGLLWSGVIVASATSYFADPVPLGPTINAVLSMQFNGFAVLIAILVVDALLPNRDPPSWVHAIAVAMGVSLGTTVFWIVSQRLIGISGAYVRAGSIEPLWPFFLRHGTHALFICGLMAFVYLSGRRAARRLAALRAAQLERVAAEKQLLESRLAAMHARVDSGQLLGTLARVQALYETQPAQADQLLKELIDRMRAAIPRTPLTSTSA